MNFKPRKRGGKQKKNIFVQCITNMARSQTNRSFSINLNPFEGDPKSLNFFFETIEELSNVNKWNDAETMLYFKSKISGPALAFFSESHSCRSAKNLSEVKKLFTEFFLTTYTPKNHFLELQNISLQENENIRSLAHRIEVLTVQAYPDIEDDKAINAIKFNQLLAALPPIFQKEILKNKVSDFNEAKNLAQNIQEVEKVTSATHFSNFLNSSHQVNSLQEKVKQLEDQINLLQSGSFRSKIKYQNNGNAKSSHTNKHDNSTKFVKKSFENNRVNKNYRSNYNSLACQFCHKKGHVLDSCYKFKRAYHRQNQSRNTKLNWNFRGNAIKHSRNQNSDRNKNTNDNLNI